jgi:hypothetical protein
LVLLVVIGFAPAAPVPQARQKPTPFHPTKKGTKWVYDYAGREEVLVVTSAEQQGECRVVSVCAEEEDQLVLRWRIVVHENGIHRLKIGDRRSCKPHWVLKLPARVGDTWEADFGTARVGALEKVEVPAGTFDAVRIDWTLPDEVASFWYAPDVGPVKVKYDGKLSVLKSFIPAKE